MSHAVVRANIKPGLDCYMLSLRPSHLVRFLGHDPRSQHWKALAPWLRGIYEQKQRVTSKARIEGLESYINDRLMNNEAVGALPPISMIQFEPFRPSQLQDLTHNAALLDDDEYDAHRVLIDGLARVTAVQAVRERLEAENPEASRLLENFRFSVALYVPTEGELNTDVAGQLFSDFNSYAWNVPPAKTLAEDQFNPYKNIAVIVGASDAIRRHGGLKKGVPKLGSKDQQFTTELTMAQFCKIAVEGRRGYMKLTRPLTDAQIVKLDPAEVAGRISTFFNDLERRMGSKRFADRAGIWRSAHGLYAIAVVVHDVFEGHTSMDDAAAGLADVDWTWSNDTIRAAIGATRPHGKEGKSVMKMNTGVHTFEWLIRYCREACNVVLTKAA